MLSVPLIAHYKDSAGVRRKSLRIIALTQQNVMLVLWENKLVPVHQPITGLTLEWVEEYVPPQAPAVVNITTSDAPKPAGRPKKTETLPEVVPPDLKAE